MNTKTIPNPKRQASNNATWYPFYAMFSDEFASQVMVKAEVPAGSVVLDPWLGVGTTLAAAAAANLQGIGVDVNPVMETIARGRISHRAAAQDALHLLLNQVERSRQEELQPDDPLLTWFELRTARDLRKWAQAIKAVDQEGVRVERRDFLLTILFEVARNLAAQNRSKNPTWIKRPTSEQKTEATPQEIRDQIVSAAQTKMSLCPEVAFPHVPDVRLGTSLKLDIEDQSVDLVLTSPPYCTRIDYAVSTRVELAVLGYPSQYEDGLRDSTMGTSTIRKNAPAFNPTAWGNYCSRFLDAVKNHRSKASFTYYYKNFLQYFDDLGLSLAEIHRCVKTGGQIVIVVQDSYYKDIHADLPRIVQEMGETFGWNKIDERKDPISRTMRSVNTRSRAYRPEVACVEKVLWFNKGSSSVFERD